MPFPRPLDPETEELNRNDAELERECAELASRLRRATKAISSVTTLAARAKAWAALPGVEAVDWGREWVERLEGLTASAAEKDVVYAGARPARLFRSADAGEPQAESQDQ